MAESPDRLAVPGATDAADVMVSYLRRRHALRQVEAVGVDMEMACRVAVTAVHLQQLPVYDQVADRYRLEPWRLRLAPAPGLLRSCSSSASSGSFEIRRASSLVSLVSETAIRHLAGRRHPLGRCYSRR